jgi:hypothetical protein
VSAPRKVVTLTREENQPRGMPERYHRSWRWVYRFEGLHSPLASIKLAKLEAQKLHPGCKVVLGWRAGRSA